MIQYMAEVCIAGSRLTVGGTEETHNLVPLFACEVGSAPCMLTCTPAAIALSLNLCANPTC